MNKKRNIYIFLTLLCLLLIVFIQALFPAAPYKEIKPSFDKAKLLKSPNLASLEIMIFMYMAIILIGFINFILFMVRNFKKGLLPVSRKECLFTLSEEKAGKLLFLVVSFALSIYIFELLALLINPNVSLKGLSLFLNLFLQIGVIFIVSRFISLKLLGFELAGRYFSFAVKAYVTALPLIIGVLFINYSILEKTGMKFSISPAIGIFLSLKNNFLIVILILQVILLGPLAEELFFRGFLYKIMRQKYGFMAAAGISSSMFAMLHRTPQEIFPLFILSVALCYVYERTQNLITPIIFHILHNGISAAFLLAIKTIL